VASTTSSPERGLVKLRALSVGFTLGAIVFLVVAFAVIARVPSLIAEYNPVGIVRFVVLFAGLLIGLAVLYRYAPRPPTAEMFMGISGRPVRRGRVDPRIAAVLPLRRASG
jgi:uncharacterized BrkB/YihY/UPF0761 family membrane protein